MGKHLTRLAKQYPCNLDDWSRSVLQINYGVHPPGRPLMFRFDDFRAIGMDIHHIPRSSGCSELRLTPSGILLECGHPKTPLHACHFKMKFSCKCSSPKLHRVRRFLRLDDFMSRLGFFPWECSRCRIRIYRKSRGVKGRRPVKSNEHDAPSP